MPNHSAHKKAPSVGAQGAFSNVVNYQENDVMQNTNTVVTPDNLPMISHAGRPVVTTALLARLYGTDDNNIIKNYQRNADRFVQGKHFHKLEGAELKAFKHCMTVSHAVEIPRQTRNLILWTERGAARHAKMLDTEQAWEVFEKMEDSYFARIESSALNALVDEIEIQEAKNKPKMLVDDVIGMNGMNLINGVIDKKISALPNPSKRQARHKLHAILHTRFNVPRTELIPSEKLDVACMYVGSYALEGEFMPKAEPQKLHLPYGGPDVRWMVSFDARGNQQVEEIPKDAYVLSQHDLMDGMVSTPGDIPVSHMDMFRFMEAGLANLKARAQYLMTRK